MTRHQNQTALATATLEAAGLPTEAIPRERVLYIAFELGEKHWKLAFTDGRR